MSISRQAIITEEKGKILAYDESMHVASHGNTEQEERDNLKEALELYYEDVDILRQRAIDMENKKDFSYHDLIED